MARKSCKEKWVVVWDAIFELNGQKNLVFWRTVIHSGIISILTDLEL